MLKVDAFDVEVVGRKRRIVKGGNTALYRKLQPGVRCAIRDAFETDDRMPYTTNIWMLQSDPWMDDKERRLARLRICIGEMLKKDLSMKCPLDKIALYTKENLFRASSRTGNMHAT